MDQAIELWETAFRTGEGEFTHDGDVEVTYGGLRESAHRIARYLWTVGVRPGDVVPIALPRSVRLAEAIWGVLAAGAAFVPIDPSYPADRIAHMVSDSGATVGFFAYS